MRVMFVLNCLGTGGAERHTYQLANALAAQGDTCTIVGLTSSYSAAGPGQESIKPAHLTKSCIKRGHLSESSVEMLSGNRIYDIGTALDLSRMIRSHAPEVIIAVDERPLLFATVSRRLAGSHAKLILILHNPDILTVRDRVLQPIHRYVVARADAMIYVAQDQRKLWEDRGYLPPTSTVIRNGVDLHRFSTHSTTEWRGRTRSVLGLRPGDYVIGLCARFYPQKNHRQLIDAIRILRSRGHPAKALLVGGGPTQASIEQYASESGVSEHILFAGFQQDVRPYTSAFDVGVLCSISEAASLVALEMMAMGLPVVLSHVGNAAEMVLPGETGFLFPPGDTMSFVDVLQSLNDPLKREAVGRAASKFVSANFGAGPMLDSYRDFLTELLAEGRRCEA